MIVRYYTRQAGNLQAHDRRQRLPLGQDVMNHLARHAKRPRVARDGQADLGKNIFPENLARMYGWQSVLTIHRFLVPRGGVHG